MGTDILTIIIFLFFPPPGKFLHGTGPDSNHILSFSDTPGHDNPALFGITEESGAIGIGAQNKIRLILSNHPEQFFDRMEIGRGDIVAVHYEACDNLHEVIADIRQRGASPFVAISPDTKPEVLVDYLDEIDGVLVMTVYPGFAGRPIVEGSFDKIKAVRKLLDSRREGILLEVDGHVSWDLCAEMRACGGDMFVAGSSSLYQKGLDISEAVERMRALIS